MLLKKLIIFLFLFFFNQHKIKATIYPFPFYDPNLPLEDRIKDLVSRLTLQEKVDQMAHGGAKYNGPAPGIPRLGIKPYQWATECLHGDNLAGLATLFPQAIGLAASWDINTIYNMARATSDEVRAKHINATKHNNYGFHTGLSCFAPVVNILRDPRWGRAQETYGEDPFLTGMLAKSYVYGLQGNHPRYLEANAGCKHFDVHSGPETKPQNRMDFDSIVGERDWKQTYLPAFKSCVKAGTQSLMCSYNKINGVPSCANRKLLTDILRNEWGFDGYVVSDNPAIANIVTHHHFVSTFEEAAALAITAGTDLEDTSPGLHVYLTLVNATRNGLVSEKQIDTSVSRLFRVRFRLGEFDPEEMVPYNFINISVVDSEEHRKIALECARKSIVLLKNERNLLPLNPMNLRTIAIIGPNGNDTNVLKGDYSPEPSFIITPFMGIQNFLKPYKVKVLFEKGCNNIHCTNFNQTAVMDIVKISDIVIVCAGLNTAIEGETTDRTTLDLPGLQEKMIQIIYQTGKPIILILMNAGALSINWSKMNIPAILATWYGGEHGGTAIADVLFGNYNPAGRLQATWYKSVTDLPNYISYSMEGRTYRYFKKEPLYPFGYGLSYTQFYYQNLIIKSKILNPCDYIEIQVTVKNIGKRDGEEVVQLYISHKNSSVPVPIRQLSGFTRIFLEVGQSKEVQFVITPEQLFVISEYDYEAVIEPGYYEIYVGGQQPHQTTNIPSNILMDNFIIKQPMTPLSKC